MAWNEYDCQVYNETKEAIREVVNYITSEDFFEYHIPAVFIDLHNYTAKFFEDEQEASEHIKEEHSDWDEEPPHDEDENLIVLQFIKEDKKERYPSTYRLYNFYKEVNGIKIYRKITCVEFEPELIINVSF